jgi:MFS family permease
MASVIRPITALLLSAGIVLAGNGLEGMLLPLRGSIEGFGEVEIGLIGSSYNAGLLIGCLICPRIIGRVGHVRAFAVFTAIATISPLIEAIWVNAPVWWVFRALTGMCIAGIMNAVESWLTSVATNANRGQVMSTYTIINFGSVMIGQQLTNVGSLAGSELFSLVAILFSLAAVPLALTLTPHPAPPRQPRLRVGQLWRVSPAAVAGSFGAGIANGAFWALGPVYARESGLPLEVIPLFMSFVLIGGAIAQWPMGRLSDRLDRRGVLAGLSLMAATLGIMIATLAPTDVQTRLILAVLFGFSALPVYWVSFAHANDLAEPSEAVDVSSSLLLLFAAGAIAGPLFAAFAMRAFSVNALFVHTAIIHGLIGAFVIYRMTRRASVPPQYRIAYHSLPKSNTPAGFEPGTSEAGVGAPASPALNSRRG